MRNWSFCLLFTGWIAAYFFPAGTTGAAIPGDFALGAGGPLDPFARPDTTAVLVAFLSLDCPVARDYLEPLDRLLTDHGGKGLRVIGVVPGKSQAEVDQATKGFRMGYPMMADPDFLITGILEATTTPEVVLLNPGKEVVYRGRVDNKYAARLKPRASVSRHDLREALTEFLEGKPVTVKVTTPIGCLIRPLPSVPAQEEPSAAKVTFYRDVLPVLQRHCQECHRPGEAGPFSLITYKDALQWADDIRDFTVSGRMPPWKPTGGVKLLHDRRLGSMEVKVLADWVSQGKKAGDPLEAPKSRVFPNGWSMGEPDLVLTVGDDFHLGANGSDHYRCFVLPSGLTRDRHIVGFEVRPGNPEVVHHVLNFFDTTGKARAMAGVAGSEKNPSGDHGPGYVSVMGIGFTPEDPSTVGGLGGWAPGMRGVRAHEGTGFLLPKGSDVILQVHYHRNGKAVRDKTRIGLYFAREGGTVRTQSLKSLVIPGVLSPSDGYVPFCRIPAGRKDYQVTGKVVVEEDARLYLIAPHMHMLGARVRCTMIPPGGTEKLILAIDEWDYAWQEVYQLAEPLQVPAGTVIQVDAVFDNSAANPFNPFSPPRNVPKGEGTHDEMLFAFLRLTSASPGAQLKSRVLTQPGDYPR